MLKQVLKCPQSDVEIVRGLKSREKTVAITGWSREDEKGCLERVTALLNKSIE